MNKLVNALIAELIHNNERFQVIAANLVPLEPVSEPKIVKERSVDIYVGKPGSLVYRFKQLATYCENGAYSIDDYIADIRTDHGDSCVSEYAEGDETYIADLLVAPTIRTVVEHLLSVITPVGMTFRVFKVAGCPVFMAQIDEKSFIAFSFT